MSTYITFPLHVTVRAVADLEDSSGILTGYLQNSDTKSRVTMVTVFPSFHEALIKCMLARCSQLGGIHGLKMRVLMSLHYLAAATYALSYVDKFQDPQCLVSCLMTTLKQSPCHRDILSSLCSNSTFESLKANEHCFIACGVDPKLSKRNGLVPRIGRAPINLCTIVNSTIQEAERRCQHIVLPYYWRKVARYIRTKYAGLRWTQGAVRAR